MQEKSLRGGDWDATISRWTKTALLQPGRNTVVGSLKQPTAAAAHRRGGRVARLEVSLYRRGEGETTPLDTARLSKPPLPPPSPTRFTVAGTDWTFSGTTSAQ